MAAAAGSGAGAAAAAGGSVAAVVAHIDANEAEWIRRLGEAVAIRSVSGDAARRPDTVRMMELVRDRISALGGDGKLVPLGPQPGSDLILPPLVTGQIGHDASKKTVLIYAHADVQPAEMSDGWATDPWKLTVVDRKMYGRGSTDDKGPLLGWLQ